MRGTGLLFLTLLLAQTVLADNIVSVQGSPISTAGQSLFADQSLVASWSQSRSYSDVSISVELLVDPVLPTENVTAYLTNEIGPGTTAAGQMAPSFTFPALPGPFPFQPTVEVFQNLTLGPGTYYLTLSSNAPTSTTPVAWSVASFSTTIETGPGVTRNSDLSSFENTQSAFAPASTFSPLSFDLEDPLEFSVTGIPNTAAVPEPSSLWLIAVSTLLAISVNSHRVGTKAKRP